MQYLLRGNSTQPTWLLSCAIGRVCHQPELLLSPGSFIRPHVQEKRGAAKLRVAFCVCRGKSLGAEKSCERTRIGPSSSEYDLQERETETGMSGPLFFVLMCV